MNIDISIDKVNYNDKRFLFFRLLGFIQNKTGFEKGKATFSKCGYIMLVRWKLSESRMKRITQITQMNCDYSSTFNREKIVVLDQDRQMNQNDQLNSVLEKIQEIVKISAKGDYLYRGEPECYDKVSSGLYRKYSDIEAEHFDIEVVQNEILEAAKRYTTETDAFEILTELQHYGGATNLIDFTTDYLIALFFACDGSDLLNEDGRVILLQKTGEINEQVKFPQNPINRVIAQKSIFVQPAKGFIKPDHVINIPKDLKQPILDHLQKYHNISTNTIYNDLHGFIKYQNVHQSASAEFFKGLMSQKEKDYSKAIKHYSNAIKLNPQMVSAYNNRGAAYSDTGAYDCAIEDLNKAIELNPNDANAYTNRGAAYSERSENDRAIEDLNKAIELNPNNAKAYNNRGNAYGSTGAYDRAIEDLNKAIELNPNDAEAYNNRGNAYGSKGAYDRAIEDLNKAIELNPNNAEAYNNRGNAYSDTGAYDRAIADYNKAIELNPDYAEAYNNRGITHSEKGAYDRAIKDYNKAIDLNPNDSDTYNNRGVAYYGIGEIDCAIKDYNKAIALNSEFTEAYYNRGLVYRDKGEYDHAIEDYSKAIALNPDYIEAYNNRGIAYNLDDKPDSAIKNFNKAIELNVEFAFAYYNRGEAWLRLRKWDNAISDLKLAKSQGLDIIAVFRKIHNNVAEFEQRYDVKLPEDIAAMLMQQ